MCIATRLVSIRHIQLTTVYRLGDTHAASCRLVVAGSLVLGNRSMGAFAVPIPHGVGLLLVLGLTVATGGLCSVVLVSRLIPPDCVNVEARLTVARGSYSRKTSNSEAPPLMFRARSWLRPCLQVRLCLVFHRDSGAQRGCILVCHYLSAARLAAVRWVRCFWLPVEPAEGVSGCFGGRNHFGLTRMSRPAAEFYPLRWTGDCVWAVGWVACSVKKCWSSNGL